MIRIPSALRWAGTILLWAVVALCVTMTVVPHFLDRIYYRGPVSGHFDGQRFFNPDGEDDALRVQPGQSRWTMLMRRALGDPTAPVWPDRVEVKQGRPEARVGGGRMVATWVGHATMLVQADGVNILTDPVLSDTAGPFGFGPRRVMAPGVRFEDLPKIDMVLVSHNHYDHLDLATLRKLWDRDRPLIVTSLGNDAVLRGGGIEAKALDWGRRVTVRPGIDVVVTRNHHWDSRWFADRNRALWSSFVVVLPHGNFFFSGDTGLGDGKWPREAATLGAIRLAGIPIGAFRFEEGEMGVGSHIGPKGAMQVWDGLGRPQAIAIHWGTFRLSREARDTPPRMLRGMMQCAGVDPLRFTAVKAGRLIEIAPLGRAAPAFDAAALAQCEKDGAFAGLR